MEPKLIQSMIAKGINVVFEEILALTRVRQIGTGKRITVQTKLK